MSGPALGIDLGTSGLKVALLDGDRLVASAHRPLTVQRPQPLWSEQDPEDWWRALVDSLDELHAREPAALAATASIGLSGQMHGATLLDAGGQVLRPCMLWNDGRSQAQCTALETRWPALRAVTGNPAMAGFTAPKLQWVREHEPAVFARTALVLLPKAWLRRRLTGEAVEEMSDASGTLWLDVGARRWSHDALAACGLSVAQMPRLVEGSEAAGVVRDEWVRRWGFAKPPVVAGGAGDNAAGAVAVGAVNAGDAFVSLGTSGVLWATTARFAPNPDHAVHAFCHALPGTWHQMGVLLAAASALGWWAQVAGCDEATLLAEAESEAASAPCWFAPYLNGERTPHADATVRGGFAGLDAGTRRADMTRAVLEGVGFALRDAKQALAAAGTQLAEADLIGGGARSALWAQTLADILDLPLHQVAHSELGGALGAARLARMAAGEGRGIATRPARLRSFAPRREEADRQAERHAQWRALYPALAPLASPR
jgi:xylulokinase